MDDLNLYGDLDEFHDQQEKKSKELQDVEEKYAKAVETIHGLKEDNKGLKKKIQRIELSFQSLLDTARTEIKRKDKEIDRLRKEKDDICFRRKFLNRPQEAPDSAAPFEQLGKNSSNTTEIDAVQLQECDQDLSNVHKSDSGCLARNRSSDRFGESHKRHRSRDGRDSYYHKRQRNDKEHQMSIYSHRDNKWDHRKIDRERHYPYKSERPQKSDYLNHERNRNRHGIECDTERHKTHREYSKSPVHGEHRKSRSEQYHNTKYSPSRRATHPTQYYSKYTNSSERNEKSHRVQPEREKNREVTKNISYSKRPEPKSSKISNTVSLEPSRQMKEQHSRHAGKQRSEDQSHSNVRQDVGPIQDESDFDRLKDKSKLTSSQNTLITSEKITTPESSKNITCTQEVAVKDSLLLEIKVTESLPNIVTNQQFNDESTVEVSNEYILNTKLTKESLESQNPQIAKSRKVSIEDCLYGYLDEETSTESQVFEVEDLLYENLDCEPCKDLKQTDAPQELATNVVYEILDDELPESSHQYTKKVRSIYNTGTQKINDLDTNSLIATKDSDTCHKSNLKGEVVCEIVDNVLPDDAFGCQTPSRNDDLQKSTNEIGNANNCGIPVAQLNMNPSKFCTPRKVALLDSLFGPSPSSASSANSNTNLLTNMGICVNNNGIDNDSTTTPPGDYSDCAILSNEDAEITPNNFDMAAFENCFAENANVTHKTLASISSEDSSVDCVMAVIPSREDIDKNSCPEKYNTSLTNILNKSSTTTSPGDSSNDCLIVVTPSREAIDGLQQTYDKTELDNCFVNNEDILLHHVEQVKLKTNLTKATSEDSSSECLLTHTQSKNVDDVPLLNNNNNNIDLTECTFDNCSREQILSNGDTINLTLKHFGEEVESSEAPVLVNATDVITSKDNKDLQVNDQLTSDNNDVQNYTNAKICTEMLNSGIQQREASEEANVETQTNIEIQTNIETQNNMLTVVKKGECGEIKIKIKATSNPTRLLRHSTKTITWDLTSPTNGAISKENNEEAIDDTAIITSIDALRRNTNNTDNNIHTNKNISVIQIVPDKEMISVSSEELIPKMHALSATTAMGFKGNIQFVEAMIPAAANELNNKDNVSVQRDAMLEYSNNSEKSLKLRYINKKCCETTETSITSENAENQTSLPTVLVKTSLLRTGSLCLEEESVPENAEDDDLRMKIDQTLTIIAPKDPSQPDCNNLRETTVNIPGLDLLCPSHKTAILADNTKCIEYCDETENVHISTADIVEPNNELMNSNKSKKSTDYIDIVHSQNAEADIYHDVDLLYPVQKEFTTLNETGVSATITSSTPIPPEVCIDISGPNIHNTSESGFPETKQSHKLSPSFDNDVVNEDNIEQQSDDTDIPPSQNAKPEVHQDVNTVSIQGLDLLYPHIDQKLATLNETGVNSTITKEKAKHDATATSSIPMPPEVRTDISDPKINNTNDTVFVETKKSHKLSHSFDNDVVNKDNIEQQSDDTDIPPSQNAKPEVHQDVDTVSIPGLDLLYQDVDQKFATLNEAGVNPTITKEKRIPMLPEVRTDISDPNIINTNDSVFPETKESHKLPHSFDSDMVNEDNIEQENDVNCCKENSEDSIKFDSVTGEKDISVENHRSEPFTLEKKFNVINDNENNTKKTETTQTKTSSVENVTPKSQHKASKEETKNINISDGNFQRTKQEIKPELKENAVSRTLHAVVHIEAIDDLELRCSKDYKRNLKTAKEESFVADEDPDSNPFNDGNVLKKCGSKPKTTEEINNNPEADISKKDTKNCRHIENKCIHLDVGEFGQNSGSQICMTGETDPGADVLEKCKKSPPLFNKPAEKVASPNLKSVSRKAFITSRELLDGMNVYSEQAVPKISASGKEMSEKSSSSNFDAIVNFERNLSLVDNTTDQFGKDIEAIFGTAKNKEDTMNNCDSEQYSGKDKNDSRAKGKRIPGKLGELREVCPKHETIEKFKKNPEHKAVTETIVKETKNANTAGHFLGGQNIPILCHKVSRILYNSSNIRLQKTNNILDLSCEEQGISPMIFKNPFQTLEQSSEDIIITPSSLQTNNSKEFQNAKTVNIPTCKHIPPNIKYFQDQNQDLTVKNLDMAENANACLNPLCTISKTPSRNGSDTINSSLNTLKTSSVSDSYGLPNNLPSISTKCPTPPNFSGIFSKISYVNSAGEDAAKYKKKSPKAKGCIIPAASVLCNVDNLHNATKASKKLYWEMLENEKEMTEIEDDLDVNSTDEEQAHEKEECADKEITHNVVTKLPTNDSILLAPYKDKKSIKETGIEPGGDKFSETSVNLAPYILMDLKLKKSFIRRRNTIDTVPPLTDDTLEQFKQLTITKLSTNESMSQTSRMPKILKPSLTPVEIKCPESLMDCELMQAAVVKSTKTMSVNTITKPVLSLGDNCKMSKNMNAQVQQMVPIQKKNRGRPPKQKIGEHNIEHRAVSVGKEWMSEKTHNVIATNRSKEKRSDNKQKEHVINCKISEENVTENASLRQRENNTIKKGPQCTGLHESTSVNNNNMNDTSAYEENPVKTDVHKTSIIYEKLTSSDEQNSSVAENSEPECNKYLKEDGFRPSSNETIEHAHTQKLKENYKNDVEPPPKLIFKSADISALINYKIPKHKQGEGTSSSDKKLISIEDISIKERPIKANLATFQMPKTVSTAKEFNKVSRGVESYINYEESEKFKKTAIDMQEQRHINRENPEGTFKGGNDKSPEIYQRRQNKKERKAHNKEDTHRSHISNLKSNESFANVAEEASTLASTKIAQTDKLLLNNAIFHVSDQGRNKAGNLKPRRKSMYAERTTKNDENLCDEDNTSRKVRALRKSLYTERHCDENDKNINADCEGSNQNTGRRKSVYTQRRILDTSSEGDENSNSKVQTKIQNELKTNMDIIASDNKINESITKSKSAAGETIKSLRSFSKTTINEPPSETETEDNRLPKTPMGNPKVSRSTTSIVTNICDTDDTEDNKIEIYNQYIQARNEYLRLHQQLLGNICFENDTKIELNRIGERQTNDQDFNETNRDSKNSNELHKNVKSDTPKQRRKTIHFLDSQISNINENKKRDVDKKSSNATYETRKTMFEGTKSSKTVLDCSPGMKLQKSSSDINQKQMKKAVKKQSKDIAETEKKEKPSKPTAMRRKSICTEKNAFFSTADHSLDHINLQKSKDLQVNSDTNKLNLGRYQDGNSRKSTRNRGKSMNIERMPVISSDDTNTVGYTLNKVYNNEACQETHNPVKAKKLLNIEEKESLKLPKTKEPNSDLRKRENNIDTIHTEKIFETYGSSKLNDTEIGEQNISSVQGTEINPIKSLRMLKKLKPSDKEAPISVEGECKKLLKKDKYENEDTINSIQQVGAEDDNGMLLVSDSKLRLNKTINDSISITFSNRQEIETQEKHLDISDNVSGSDTSTMAQNIKNKKIRLKPFNIQRRIMDSSSSDAEEAEMIANHEKSVEDNANEQTATILAVKEKSSRKRRIVKVLSTSFTDDQIAKKVKCTPDQFEVTTPASSPTLNHSIFNTQVPDKSQSHLNLTPLSYDDRFQEIDSTLHDMFESPQHETEGSNLPAAQDTVISVLATESLLNNSGANITIDKTAFINRENDETSLNISGSYDSKSLNSSASQDQSATKYLSLGTSNYRFEKVSENVVNLFISRKRKRNKPTNNINDS